MSENVSEMKEAFSLAMYQMHSLGDCVTRIAIKDTNSQMFLCSPWENILLWANKVEDRHLPYGDTKFDSHYASLNYCISGRCEVCLPDNTYIYMEPGMLCIDDHKPKDGYWYPGQSYSGLEVVFDLDRLLTHPLPELSVYCDYDGWVREMLSTHDGTYLATVGNECERLMNLLCSHLEAADWNLLDYRLHLLLLFYALVNDGTVPVKEQFYVTKGQKHIAGEVEQMITRDLSCHYTITDMAAIYAVMPFLVSFGCNIAGATGVRVLDIWGQRMAAISMSWVVPCGSTWAVVGLVASVFFGPGAAPIIFLLFAVSVLHLQLTARVFGKRFLTESDRTGLIMELPPYHKARWGSLIRNSAGKMAAAFKRAISIVTVVFVVMWALSYTKDGNLAGSILYRIGSVIEPVTMWFGLRWQTFIAWAASMMGKEGSLGVLAAVFNDSNVLHSVARMSVEAADSVSVGESLAAALTKPEALAFIFAFYFNMPCLMTMSATVHETRSLKWTLRVAGYYIIVSLVLATAAYHIGCLIF